MKYILVSVGVFIFIVLIWTCSSRQKATADTSVKQSWGQSYNNLALSIQLPKISYHVNETIEVLLTLMNTGTEKKVVLQHNQFLQYRIILVDQHGNELPKTTSYQEIENTPPADTMNFFALSSTILHPNHTVIQYIKLNEWYKIQQPGTYHVCILREADSWEQGFVVSNVIEFKAIAEKRN